MTLTANGKKIGQPTKCTPELLERILPIVRQGHYIATACQSVGIGTTTLSEWGQRAVLGEEPYASFTAALKDAHSEAEIALGDMVLRDAKKPGGWLPAMTYLERTRPDRWGRRDRIQVDRTTQVVFRHEEISKSDRGGVVEVEGRVVSQIPEKGSE